jgi:hypothetical protein
MKDFKTVGLYTGQFPFCANHFSPAVIRISVLQWLLTKSPTTQLFTFDIIIQHLTEMNELRVFLQNQIWTERN